MNDLGLVRMFLHDTMVERHVRGLPAKFPFTGGHVQRMARRRGYCIGEHRALRMVALLISAGEIIPCGSYRQPYLYAAGDGAFRVPLFHLPPALRKASVRRRKRVKPVKRRRYALTWAHPLFGCPTERPPPEWEARKRREREERKEQLALWEAAAWA